MEKFTQSIVSGLALLVGVTSLAVSLTQSGPTGPVGSSGANGVDGSQGASGENGEDGFTPYIGINGNWWIGEQDSGVAATGIDATSIPIPSSTLSFSPKETMLTNEVLYAPFTTEQDKFDYAQMLIQEQGYIGISSANALMNISDKNGKYVLTNDILFTIEDEWSPINFLEEGIPNPFSGILDGAGFRISELHYEGVDFTEVFQMYGLFDGLMNATIKNLYLYDFNMYTANNQGRSLSNVGALSSYAVDSILYNINLIRPNVSGEDYVGGLVGSLINSSARFITADVISVWGNNFVGGLFGWVENSDITNINIQTEIVANNNFQGGLSGYSENSFYNHVEVDIQIQATPSINANNQTSIGGVIGESYHDRFFDIRTTGVMEYIVQNNGFYLANVGGVIGYANNIVLADIQNTASLFVYMNDETFEMTIRSIAGIVGSVDFGTFHQVANFAQVLVAQPASGLNIGLYINNEEHPVEYVGGIIGYVYGSVNLYQVLNTGFISGITEVGGIIGSTGIPYFYLQQLIVANQVANLGSVYAYLVAGGFMGISDVRTNLILANFMNFGNVGAMQIAGGIIGIVAPILGIKVQIINSFNRGVITAQDYGVGGLIAGVVPEGFNFEFPVFGEVHIYNSFNVGLIQALELGQANTDYEQFSGGAIIGFRLMLVSMYSVSYTVQETVVDTTSYDGDLDEYIPNGGQYVLSLPGVGGGNDIDMNAIHNSQFLFNPTMFLYRTIWNFDTVWTSSFDFYDGLPSLRFLNQLFHIV